jgi:xylose isomerase
MNEYFPSVPKIAYEGPKTVNPIAFRWYAPDEVIAGKKMREHLKFALSYWHTMCGDGTDMFGRRTADKRFGETDPMAAYKAKAYAAFELMDKLSIDYFCFHDRDIAPEAETLA